MKWRRRKDDDEMKFFNYMDEKISRRGRCKQLSRKTDEYKHNVNREEKQNERILNVYI
jgi:hypothetical protein